MNILNMWLHTQERKGWIVGIWKVTIKKYCFQFQRLKAFLRKSLNIAVEKQAKENMGKVKDKGD